MNLNPENTFTLDVNHLADWTPEEYQSLLGFSKSPLVSSSSLPNESSSLPPDGEYNMTVSAKGIDWRSKGALNGIKDEGKCSASWAFSAVGAIESGY